MSAWTSVHMGGGVQAVPTPTGNELTGSRRQIDIADIMYARHSYAGAGILTDCRISIGYSIDGGATWQQLLPPGPQVLTANYVFMTEWTDIRPLVSSLPTGMTDLWVNALQWGASLLGLTANVQFVELQLR